MAPTITLFYAAIISLWLIVLSARVIVYRRRERVELGSGDHRTLAFRIRALGNLTEYAPLALILLALIELQEAPIWVVHLLGIVLLLGRIIHGWAFSFGSGHMRGRVLGMVLTLTAIGASALFGLVLAVL